jgi:uncharacterized protein (TIGR00251 family)
MMTESDLTTLLREGQKIFACKIKPNAAKTAITAYKDSVFHIDVKAQAQNNKANNALIKFLRKVTGKELSIHSGNTSRTKLIKITN